jgi:hypothetical protein
VNNNLIANPRLVNYLHIKEKLPTQVIDAAPNLPQFLVTQ